MLSLGNLTGYLFARGEYKEQLTQKPLTYVIGSNGSFEVRSNLLGTFTRKIDNIQKIEEVQEGVQLQIPKIPFSLFNKIAVWFRTIYLKDKTESTIMVFYNEKNGFSLFVPKQINASASSTYERDDDAEYTALSKKNTLVMVAHSHPWKGSSAPNPSSIDNADEKEALLYMILNNVEDIPNVYCSTCPGGKRIKMDFFDIFENPMLTALSKEDKDLDENLKHLMAKHIPAEEIIKQYFSSKGITIPAKWIAKHSVRRTQTAVNSAYSGYSRGVYDYRLSNGRQKLYDYDSYYSFMEEEELDDEIAAYYKSRSTISSESEKKNKTSALVDKESFNDVMDMVLDFTESQMCTLFETLIEEGHAASLYDAIQEYDAGLITDKTVSGAKDYLNQKDYFEHIDDEEDKTKRINKKGGITGLTPIK